MLEGRLRFLRSRVAVSTLTVQLHEPSPVLAPLVDKAPGLTLGPYGQWFNRNETWAEQAHAWIDYIARSSYLLLGEDQAAVFRFDGNRSRQSLTT